MLTLCIPHRSVVPADFPGPFGFCQNLDCLASVEPPYQVLRLCLPDGTLETILCSACMPQPAGGTFPSIRLEVVAARVEVIPHRPGDPPEFPVVWFEPSPPESSPPPHPAADQASNRQRKPRPTFEALAAQEPRLRDLLAEARSFHDNRDPVFCANAVWIGYGDFRPGLKYRLSCLVGWGAEQGGELRTSDAYDVAYETISQALPDCRGRCLCLL
jgi:hypothetical protein